ncbi:MAG: hypothetical protein ACYTG0_31480 [Planctomycetota bacterium]
MRISLRILGVGLLAALLTVSAQAVEPLQPLTADDLAFASGSLAGYSAEAQSEEPLADVVAGCIEATGCGGCGSCNPCGSCGSRRGLSRLFPCDPCRHKDPWGLPQPCFLQKAGIKASRWAA